MKHVLLKRKNCNNCGANQHEVKFYKVGSPQGPSGGDGVRKFFLL